MEYKCIKLLHKSVLHILLYVPLAVQSVANRYSPKSVVKGVVKKRAKSVAKHSKKTVAQSCSKV